MILIEATSIMWLIVLVVWGYALGMILAEVVSNWWRVERAVSEWWANLPPVARLRLARAREDFNWWWVNATPEQRRHWQANTEWTKQMAIALAEVQRAFGVTVEEATAVFSRFAEACRDEEA